MTQWALHWPGQDTEYDSSRLDSSPTLSNPELSVCIVLIFMGINPCPHVLTTILCKQCAIYALCIYTRYSYKSPVESCCCYLSYYLLWFSLDSSFFALTGVYISYLHKFFLSARQYLLSKSNSWHIPGTQCSHAPMLLLVGWFLLDFGSANCIFNLPLMNFQFDNAAHERAEATHLKTWKTDYTCNPDSALLWFPFPIPLRFTVEMPLHAAVLLPIDWLSLFAFLARSFWAVLNANKISNIQIFNLCLGEKIIGLRLPKMIAVPDNTFTAQRDLLMGVVDVRLLLFLIGICTAPTRSTYWTLSIRVYFMG